MFTVGFRSGSLPLSWWSPAAVLPRGEAYAENSVLFARGVKPQDGRSPTPGSSRSPVHRADGVFVVAVLLVQLYPAALGDLTVVSCSNAMLQFLSSLLRPLFNKVSHGYSLRRLWPDLVETFYNLGRLQPQP